MRAAPCCSSTATLPPCDDAAGARVGACALPTEPVYTICRCSMRVRVRRAHAQRAAPCKVTLRARWVTLRARWVTSKSSLGDAESSLGDSKSSLGDAERSLGDAESSLGDAESSLGDAESSLGDAASECHAWSLLTQPSHAV
jgi:hypothetical protein